VLLCLFLVLCLRAALVALDFCVRKQAQRNHCKYLVGPSRTPVVRDFWWDLELVGWQATNLYKKRSDRL
jgi:hypothetical protein